MYAARAEHARFRRMRAARAELDHGPAAGHFHRARRLGRDERLEGHRREHVGFRDLRLDDGRADGEDRLAGKHRGAFGDGEEIAGEAEAAQVIEEGRRYQAERIEAAKVIDLFGGETQVEQVIDHLREAGGEDEIAMRRETADGVFEDGFLGDLAGFEVAGGHGELVEIGEESVHGRGADALVRAGPPGPALPAVERVGQGARPTKGSHVQGI